MVQRALQICRFLADDALSGDLSISKGVWGSNVPNRYCIARFSFSSVSICFTHSDALVWGAQVFTSLRFPEGLTPVTLYSGLRCRLLPFSVGGPCCLSCTFGVFWRGRYFLYKISFSNPLLSVYIFKTKVSLL